MNNTDPSTGESSSVANVLQNVIANLGANPQAAQAQAAAQQLFAMTQPQQQLEALRVNQTPQPHQAAQNNEGTPNLGAQSSPVVSQPNGQVPGGFWPNGFSAMPQAFNNPFALLSMIQQFSGAGGFGMPNTMAPDPQRFANPIPPSDGYDAAVADRLHKAESEGQSAKDALHGMQGVYNHAASLWIDYYLDRMKIINKLVEGLAQPPKTVKRPAFSTNKPDTVKRPVFNSVKVKTEPTPVKIKTESASVPLPAKRGKATNTSTSAAGPSNPSRSSRTTANSMSSRYFAPPVSREKSDTLPTPPSREPTPPSEVVRHSTNRGNAFTEADIEYLINYTSWAVSKNPEMPRSKILRAIARKAPHHPEASWGSKWNNLPIVDQIYHNAGQPKDRKVIGDDESSSSESNEEWEEPAPVRPPKRRRVSEPSGKRVVPPEDIEVMGRWVAQHYSDWKAMSDKMRWKPFAEDNPKRTHAEWAEVYERSKNDVVARARELRGKKS